MKDILEYDDTKCPLCGSGWGSMGEDNIAECLGKCGMGYIPPRHKYRKVVGGL
jgi:hypothetical protein